jgi:hypothetical protein
MLESALKNVVTAEYIGNGCFIREDNLTLAFVKRVNRPEFLREGCTYSLTWHADKAGVIYYVYDEVRA